MLTVVEGPAESRNDGCRRDRCDDGKLKHYVSIPTEVL